MADELHCLVTNNRCGTDTWPVGNPCACNNCRRFMWDQNVKALEQIARLAGEVAQLQQEATKFTDAMTQAARQIRSLERTIVTIQTDLQAAEGEVARLREQLKDR